MMTPEEQRIAIAEVCGYRADPLPDVQTFWTPSGGRVYLEGLPDYLSDLNAMHEAEKVLIGHFDEYVCNLSAVMKLATDDYMLVHATAAQRAEALLRTLSKWTD